MKTAQGIGCSVGSLVALQHYLWLTLMDVSYSEKALLLDMPISPHGLFGNVVGYFSEKFLKFQKQSKVLSHVLPNWAAAPSKCPRSSSTLRPFWCQDRSPAPSSSGWWKDPEPAVKPKSRHFKYPKKQGPCPGKPAPEPSLVLEWSGMRRKPTFNTDDKPPSKKVHLAVLHPSFPCRAFSPGKRGNRGSAARAQGKWSVLPLCSSSQKGR